MTQILRFRDLLVGDLFEFETMGTGVMTRSTYGTYRKTSSRRYTYGSKKTIAAKLANAKKLAKIYNYAVPRKLDDMHVGSINAKVVRIRGK
jgi:hypothetical protein